MKKLDHPRLLWLHVKNYRALKDVKIDNLQPLSVFLGPNGSGKSTVFDVLQFLADCFNIGLVKAWEKRGRFKELRTRGQQGPIVFELQYKESNDLPKITYRLEIVETNNRPFVTKESLRWRRGSHGKPFDFLNFSEGKGIIISGDQPDEQAKRIEESLSSPDLLAVNTFGALKDHPRIVALRNFITGWYLSYITADQTRSRYPEAGAQEYLSPTGDNLPNVVQYLSEQYPGELGLIFQKLQQRIPRLEKISADVLEDGRLLLRIKDAPFQEPILAKYASDGTLKMLAYLLVLYNPAPPPVVGIEEPEHFLHPKLLLPLAEECREASANTQLLVSSHSPFFVNGLQPDELWVLSRDKQGYTQVKRAADMLGVKEMYNSGNQLGYLWMEGHFDSGDPFNS